MKKRFLSLLLTLCMIVTVLSTASFAADEETLAEAASPTSPEVVLGIDLDNVTPEDNVTADTNNADIVSDAGDVRSNSMTAESAVISAQTFQLTSQVDGCDINLQSIDQEFYLFLPASADFTKLKLMGNATLKNGDGEITLSETLEEKDLTVLFGADMKDGTKYTADVYSGEEKVTAVTFMKASNLPTMYITSDKTVAELHTSKSVAGKGKITLANVDGTKRTDASKLASIKGRGNSSWNSSGEKRPYNIKLDKKAELIEGAGSAKKWCLISDNCQGGWVDVAAGLANMAAYDMYEAIGGDSALAHETINLYINGEYRGVYLLTEKVEINKERVNITESNYSKDGEDTPAQIVKKSGDVSPFPQYWAYVSTAKAIENDDDPAIKAGVQAYKYSTGAVLDGNSGGFLLELDRGFSSEASWFITKRGYPYVLKEPEFATQEQVQMIAQYVQKYEDAVYAADGCAADGTYYADLIDLDSLAKKVMIDMVSAQCDTFVTSCFFSIDTNAAGLLTGKLAAGPAWDYDGSYYGSQNMPASYMESDYNAGIRGSIYSQGLVGRFYLHGDFSAKMAALSSGMMKSAWSDEIAKVTEYVDAYRDSYAMNTVLWNNDGTNDRPGDLDAFKTSFENRYNYWYHTLYSEDRLLGVTAAAETEAPNTLKATVNGTAKTYQWYKISGNTLVAVDGAVSDTFTPDSVGTYYCKVTGTSIGGKLNVTAMTSNPVDVGVTNVDVAFKPNNGTEDYVVSVKSGRNVMQPDHPQKTGYLFDGWYTDEACKNAFDFTAPVYENTTVYAKWTAEKYTITYHLNGGTNAESNPDSYTVEQTVTLADPSKTGYLFDGWYTDEYCENAFDFTAPANENITVYAKWTAEKYTITYHLNGGTNAESNPDSYTVEQTVTLADPSKTGYTFTGWTWDGQTTPVGNPEIAAGSTGNRAYEANWKEEEKLPVITDFTDVKSDDWFYAAVKWALDQKITTGTSTTTYSPNQGCTRAQIVTFLWRAFGEPEPTTTQNPFTDVTQDESHKFYYKAILWAAEKGITTGTTETTFSPDAICTRAQIVTFLHRAAGEPAPKDNKMPFTDVKQDEYYYNAVQWACENGIAKGMTTTQFSPNETCTRAQSVTFVYRAEAFLG